MQTDWGGGQSQGQGCWGVTLPTKATSWAPAGLSFGLSQNSELSSDATENWTSPRPQDRGSEGVGLLPTPPPRHVLTCTPSLAGWMKPKIRSP